MTGKAIKTIILIFLVWRILLLIPFFVGNKYIPYHYLNRYNQISAYTSSHKLIKSIFVYPWANFDGVHYLKIAHDGYQKKSDGRFFPFYPILIFVVSSILGERMAFGEIQVFSALLISNILFLLSLLLLYKIVRLDYSENTAFWTIIFLLVFPTSFFYGSIYSESTFLFLTLLSLYSARRQKFMQASIVSLLLSVTRIVGITIIFSLIYELVNKKVNVARNKIITKGLPIILVPLGIISFMIFNQIRWGDWLLFIHEQQNVVIGRTHLIFFFPQTLFRYAKILITVSPSLFAWWISLLELSSFIFACFLIYLALRKRIHFSYVLFSLFCFLIPASSGTFTALPRYISVLFPMFIVLALIKNNWLKISISVLMSILLFVLAMLFSRGYFIS